MDSNYKIRKMLLTDFPQCVELWNQEQWNEFPQDAQAFFATDSNGFFVGELNGEIVGTISATKYKEYSHIGLYLVRPEFRGSGFGLALFNYAMDYLKDMKITGLDAREAQVKNYQKQDFKIYFKGSVFSREAQGTIGSHLVDFHEFPMDKLVAYDSDRFKESREALLKAFLEEKTNRGFVFVEDGDIKGYGIIRGTRQPYKIQPFVADDKRIAEEILSGIQSLVKGEKVMFSTFEECPEMQELFKEQQWSYVRPFYRMYKNGQLGNDLTKPYGPILELG